jgi:hypothetical protein
MAGVAHHCCECGNKAADPYKFDVGAGRTACTQKCADKLNGKGVPEHKRKGFYCNTHPRAVA